jgi:hypothetical protein
MDRRSVPYWADKFRSHINSLGHDVLAKDGEECDAFEPAQ